MRYRLRKLQDYAEWEFSEVRIEPAVNFKVAPSEPAPVITIRRGKPRITMMSFGLASGREGKGRQLMARGETIDQKPMFRHSFKDASLRCIILVNGFFDSLDMGRFKQPYHIHRRDDETMGFAGLWEERAEADNFTIISCVPNQVVRPIIDRMPVILPRELWRPWLEPSTRPEDLKTMLAPYPPEGMEAYPVTRKVNQPGFNGPECIEPIVPEQSELPGLF